MYIKILFLLLKISWKLNKKFVIYYNSRADTLILDMDNASDGGLGKLLADKDSNGSESRPQTPNPVLAASNVSWHNCRRLIYVPRSAQKGIF